MASSTTMPMARISPNSVRRLIEKPSRYMPAKAPTMRPEPPEPGSGSPAVLQEQEDDQHHQHDGLDEGRTTSSMETWMKRVVLNGTS